MRTTVSISDDLLTEAKLLAARTGRSLGDVVDDALRVLLAQRAQRRSTEIALPTFGGSGLLPGVDLEDKELLAALLEDGTEARAPR
jgi:Arc/MetJ family transcription regulator